MTMSEAMRARDVGPRRSAVVLLVLITFLATGLAACGKKGDLEAPSTTEWNEPDPQHPRGHGFDN
jgi:predicted small lipoprotein YifL